MMEETVQEALNIALKYVLDAEIYLEKIEKIDVELKKDQIDFAKEVSSYGLGVRVITEGKMGFAYTNNMANIQKTVEKSVFNAKCNMADDNFVFAPESKYHDVKGVYDHNIRYMNVEEAVNFAKIMIETANYQKCQPTSGGVSAGCLKTFIINSEGLFTHDMSTIFSGFISLNTPDGEGVSTAHESDSSRYLDLDPEKISLSACKIAKDSRNGKSIETSDMNVLLDYNAAASLSATFANALNADNVQRGRSLYADKVGESILSPSLNVYDDATIQKGLNSTRSDGEGVPSQKTTLVEKGILKDFIYDIYTANKGGVKSTGNGIRSSYSDMPSVDFSNFIMDFQDISEIIDVKRGLMVTDVLGAHTANPISGDFSVEAMNAFYIERGEIAYPVKKAMISGNIFATLQKACASSKKARQIGPFILPPILTSKLRVVG